MRGIYYDKAIRKYTESKNESVKKVFGNLAHHHTGMEV